LKVRPPIAIVELQDSRVIRLLQLGDYVIDSRKGWFDAQGFYAALDAERQARKLNWKQVAAESGVGASTLTRMAQGKRPDVDGLAALGVWSGLNVDDFVRADEEQKVDAEPLAMISTYLRGDRNLTPEAATALEELIKATYARLRKD
jgi:transcriptional regulator with XRE-family HTH domain